MSVGIIMSRVGLIYCVFIHLNEEPGGDRQEVLVRGEQTAAAVAKIIKGVAKNPQGGSAEVESAPRP